MVAGDAGGFTKVILVLFFLISYTSANPNARATCQRMKTTERGNQVGTAAH